MWESLPEQPDREPVAIQQREFNQRIDDFRLACIGELCKPFDRVFGVTLGPNIDRRVTLPKGPLLFSVVRVFSRSAHFVTRYETLIFSAGSSGA